MGLNTGEIIGFLTMASGAIIALVTAYVNRRSSVDTRMNSIDKLIADRLIFVESNFAKEIEVKDVIIRNLNDQLEKERRMHAEEIDILRQERLGHIGRIAELEGRRQQIQQTGDINPGAF